jgi:hypothetical protein
MGYWQRWFMKPDRQIEPFKKTVAKWSSKLLIPYGEGGGIR